MTGVDTGAGTAVRGRGIVVRRLVNALLGLTLGIDALFLLGLCSPAANSPLVGIVLSLGTQWVPVTVFWIVVAATSFRQLPVILAAAGVTFSAIGDTYYALAMDADGYLAFPSPADVGYLLFYPLMVAALVLLARRRLHGSGGLVLLDTAIATVGASAVLALILDPALVAAMSGEDELASAIALGYPVFDLLMLAVIAGVAAVPTVSIGRRWWALVTGLGIFAAADVVFAVLERGGAYGAGTPLDATWAVGLAFITWWVAATPLGTEPPRMRHRRVVVPLPTLAVVTGVVVLIIGTQVRLSVLAVVLAAATVALAAVPTIFRQAMLSRVLAVQDEALQRITELDRAKTDMLVTMNHGFRTPLTSITGHVELLLDDETLSPAAAGALRTIERNAARLQQLIDETLTASRLETGREPFEQTEIGVAELVGRAIARVEPLADARGVVLEVVPGSPDLVVAADSEHLERAVVNLLDNAIKFTAAGGHVRVDVDGPTRGGEVEIRIADDGMGIPAADIPHLFTRFFRASNVQNAAIPGVGLGLSITRQIVRAHGGTVAVESVLDRGTTVRVRLRLSRPTRTARRAPHASTAR
ncbi:sensor histidine kinase [Pseudolysinimonas sp.]|jgi:signal transduction histidine kinase|uniref:sensor histidine kinase n=1 Tax=Pseudolysinimonas sp. TaxID=2680009 RepID=UPI0037836795